MERIEDLITMGGGPVATMPTGRVEAALSVTVNHQPPPKIKHEEDDRLLWSFIKEFCGPKKWCSGHPVSERPMPPSNEMVESDMNSLRWQERLPTLTLRRVAAYRRGLHDPNPRRDEGLTGKSLHLKPTRTTRRRGAPAILIRLDADAHHGEPDARELIERLDGEFFEGRLYHEPSRRGHAGYLVIDIASYPQPIDGQTIYPSAKRINASIDDLQSVLAALAKHWGYKAPLEVNGRLMITDTMDDGTRRVVNAGQWLRAPRCPNAGDVRKLMASRYGDGIIHRIVARAAAVPAEPQGEPPQSDAPTRPTRPEKPKKRRSKQIADTGDVFENRLQCAVVVKGGWMLDRPPEQITEDDLDLMVNQANELYERHGLNRNERDRDRDKCFRQMFRWLLRTHDPDARGRGGLWFDEVIDVDAASRLIRSRYSKARLRQINRKNRKLLRGHKIGYLALAIALCAYVKDTRTNNGYVPAKAIGGMLRSFGISASNMGSLVNIIKEILMEIRLLRYLSTSYKRGRWCRRYQTLGKANQLPFVADYQSDAGGERDKTEIQGAGRGPTTINQKKYKNSSLSSMQRNRLSHFFENNGSEMLDEGYWASLVTLQAEYCPN